MGSNVPPYPLEDKTQYYTVSSTPSVSVTNLATAVSASPPPAYAEVSPPPVVTMKNPPIVSVEVASTPVYAHQGYGHAPGYFEVGNLYWIPFGPYPTPVTCPHCRIDGVTNVQYDMGTCGWIAVIFLFIICFPLTCLPCLINEFQDAYHSCSNCYKLIGVYRR